MKQTFTLGVFAEEKTQLISRAMGVFTKRKVPVNSLNVSETEVDGVYRIVFEAEATKEQIQKVAKQLQKMIDVVQVQVFTNEDAFQHELALYKLPTSIYFADSTIDRLVRQHSARLLFVGPEYLIVEKTGSKEETQQLFNELQSFGVLEFTRTGTVFVSKSNQCLQDFLNNQENHSFQYQPVN